MPDSPSYSRPWWWPSFVDVAIIGLCGIVLYNALKTVPPEWQIVLGADAPRGRGK